MFSSSGSSRKPLLRSNSGSDRPSMRNWPLFVFLFGLVFFFYVFYIYQAQSTEMSVVKEQLESQLLLVKNLKNQLVDCKAEGERLRTSEESLKTANQDLTTKYEECSTGLRAAKVKSENLGFEKSKFETSISDKDTRIAELEKSVAELERNQTTLQSLYTAQEQLATQLNQTVNLLQSELKSASPKNNVDSVKEGGEGARQAQAQLNQTTPANSVVGGQVAGKVDAELPVVERNVDGKAPGTDGKPDVKAAESEGNLAEQAQTVAQPAVAETNVDRPLAEQPIELSPDAKTNTVAAVVGTSTETVGKGAEPEDNKAAEQNDDAAQLDIPKGPGERVPLEEAREKQRETRERMFEEGAGKQSEKENRPIVQGGDYQDEQQDSAHNKGSNFADV